MIRLQVEYIIFVSSDRAYDVSFSDANNYQINDDKW